MEENHMGWQLVQGVRQDLVKLFLMYAKMNSVRYEDYSKIWKQMKFFTIFCCRYTYIERVEFIEELFQIVKVYLSPVYEFSNRIAALYTLYGLYFKQPLKEPVKIRFTKSEWIEFQSLIEICKSEKHYDAVFIYLKMLLDSAFVFTAVQRVAGLETGFRKYSRQRFTFPSNNFHIELLYKPLLHEKLVSSFIKLEELYCKKKMELLGEKNLHLIDPHFSSTLQNELKIYAANHNNRKEVQEFCESEVNKDKASSSQESNKDKTSDQKTVSRKKTKGKYLFPKEKAELYMKQLLKDSDKKKSDENNFELPELDFS